MSAYNGNDSLIKLGCREMAMEPINKNVPVNLLVIAFPEQDKNGNVVCKDVEILRKSGVEINHIVWVNNSWTHVFSIMEYMNKHFPNKNTGIMKNLNLADEELIQICSEHGKFNLVFLDYCNLLSPEHQIFWSKLIELELLESSSKISVTLQVHGRNYSNLLNNKYGIEPWELLSEKCYGDFCFYDRVDNRTWCDNPIMLSDYCVKILNRIFPKNIVHCGFNSKTNWDDIPINETIKEKMYFKSIFAISVASLTNIFKKKASLKNGEAFIYNAEHSNKMAFICFERIENDKGMIKGSVKAIKAGQKAKVSRKYNALIKEALTNGDTKKANSYKAVKQRFINEIENQ